MNDIELYENISELEKDFPIKVRRYKGHSLSPHWHEHIELLHLLSGSGIFSCNTKTTEAHCGETIVVNSNELHSFEADNDIDYICVIINPAIFDDVNCKNTILESKIPKDEFITSAFSRIYNEYEKNSVCSDMIIKGEIYLLMAYLIKNHTSVHLSQSEYNTRINRIEKINSFLDYIHKNYNRPLTTSDLANKWYITESYLCKIFKHSVGISVLEYLNSFRIYKAAILLKNTDEDISEIARSVGFDNLNYFDRIFKRYKGTSPKKYRNLMTTPSSAENIV